MAAAVPSASASASVRAVRLRRLLEAYHDVAWASVAAPPVLFLRRGRRRLGRLLRLPRPSWLLRYFVVQHVHHRLDEIERRLSALAAFADDRTEYARELEMVGDFRRSLPSRISRRLLIALTVIGTVLATRFIAELALDRSRAGDKKELELLVKLEDSLLSLNVSGGFLETLATSPISITLDLLFGLVVCAYLVLRLAYPGFRLKRMLFNVHPGGLDALRSAAVKEHVSAVDGLYRLEAEVLPSLGVRAPREFPFDLAISTFGAVLWTFIGAALLVDSDSSGGWVLVTGVIRLAWLGRAERRRLKAEPLSGESLAEPARALAPS